MSRPDSGQVADGTLHTLTGAAAVAALPELERARFEAHLSECDACADEVRELRAAAAQLAIAVAQPPPVGLKERVLAEIATVRQLSPVPRLRSEAPIAAPRPWWRTPMSAAAAVLLAVSVGLGALVVRQDARIDELAAQQQRVDRLVNDPARVTRNGTVRGGGSSTVVAAGGQALFLADRLPPPPAGRTYQLWVIRGGAARSAGVLSLTNGAATQLVPDVRASDTFGLTVEPAGGSSQPTTTPVLTLQV